MLYIIQTDNCRYHLREQLRQNKLIYSFIDKIWSLLADWCTDMSVPKLIIHYVTYSYSDISLILLCLIKNKIYFQHPEKLLHLSCDWNFIVVMCLRERRKCKKAMKEGAAIIHGINYTFFTHRNRRFKVLMNLWYNSHM